MSFTPTVPEICVPLCNGTSPPPPTVLTIHTIGTPGAPLLVLLAKQIYVNGILLILIEFQEFLHLNEAPCWHKFRHYLSVFLSSYSAEEVKVRSPTPGGW